MRLSILVALVSVLFGCEEILQKSDLEEARADYCQGDSKKCTELEKSTNLSSLIMISSDSEVSSSLLIVSSVLGSSFDLSSAVSSSSSGESSSLEPSSSSLDVSSSLEVSSSTDLSSSLGVSSDAKSSEGLSSSLQASSSSELDVAMNNQNCTYSGATNTLVCIEKSYKTVNVDGQVWMAENLNYGVFLSNVGTDSQYQLGSQKFCYANNEDNCTNEGGLYQWHTAMDLAKECGDGSSFCSGELSAVNHQGICPNNWHIPKKEEWEALIDYLGGVTVAGQKLKAQGMGGSDEVGFSAVATGSRNSTGVFGDKGASAYFWEAEESDANIAYYRYLSSSKDNVARNFSYKRSGFSVRCVKD